MLKRFFRAIAQLVSTFKNEFIFVFRIAPRSSFALTFFQLIIGVVPAIELYVGAKIIDELLALSGENLWSPHLVWLAIITLVLLGIQRLSYSINDYLLEYLRNSLHMAVSDRIHRMILGLDLPLLEQSKVHTTITYLKDQSWRPMQMVYAVFQGFGNIVASISYVILAMTFSPFLAILFLIAVLPSLVISIWAIYSGQAIAWGKASLMKQVWYFESLFRMRHSLVELMVHNIGTFFANRYVSVYKKVAEKEMDIEKRRLTGGVVANLGAFVVYIFVYVRIITSVLVGVLTIGQFTLYIGAFMNLERFLVSQVWQLAMLLEHTKYLDSFRELEAFHATIKDVEGAKELTDIQSIEFKNVSFRYPGSEHCAVSDVSFVILEHERVALVGENGAGKSTLVKLMLRLYEPTDGEILINGSDYKTYTLLSLRKQIGVTFQDYLQFSLSVRENIAVGDLQFLQESFFVERAAQQAGIHQRITELPKGYETILGHEFHEDGIELSGGEWQKVALARSLIKDASLLILDEPTAALDARSEYQFFKELFQRAKQQAVLVISHRFSSVRVADRILVFQNGRLVEEGKHNELMKEGGLYQELYDIQTRDFT